MDIEQAQDAKRELEIVIMKMIREYEKATGLRITKANMEQFQDTRYFSMTAYMPPKTKKKHDA